MSFDPKDVGQVLDRYRDILKGVVNFTDLEYRKNPEPWKIRSLIQTRLKIAETFLMQELEKNGETFDDFPGSSSHPDT